MYPSTQSFKQRVEYYIYLLLYVATELIFEIGLTPESMMVVSMGADGVQVNIQVNAMMQFLVRFVAKTEGMPKLLGTVVAGDAKVYAVYVFLNELTS